MLHAIIIDDEHTGREVLRLMLERFCPEVKVAAVAGSAEEGRAMIDLHQPDLVFLDVEMPLKSGFDLLEEIPGRSFPVVIVSAHERYKREASRHGAAAYLLKPVGIGELRKTVAIIEASRLPFAKNHTIAAGERQSSPAENDI